MRDELVTSSRIDLERIRATVADDMGGLLTPDARHNLAVEVVEDIIARRFVAHLRRHILGLNGEEQVRTVRYPRDWWQAVKLRFAPRWFTRRWRVVFVEHRLEVKSFGAVCPHHDKAGAGEHIEWLSYITTPPPPPFYAVNEGDEVPV